MTHAITGSPGGGAAETNDLSPPWSIRFRDDAREVGSAAVSFNDDESYELFLILDSLARIHRGEDPIVNHFRERLLPVYRDWHAANPGKVRPRLAASSADRGTPNARD